METFTHTFGGWKSAEARRWTNPDGSVGGIVAISAEIPDETFVPQLCEVWPYARIGSRPIIAVWYSNGAASAVAAKLTLERYAESHDVRILNSPIDEEDTDNNRFRRDVERWLGVPVESVVNTKLGHTSANDVWAARRFMSGPEGAPCTLALKKQARYQWEREFTPAWHVLGFTADEEKRHKRFVLTERENVLPVLIDEGITKADCLARLRAAGIKPPRVYGMGYPNANCIGCVKATSPTYWNLVRRTHPDVFAARAALSAELGTRLVRVKGQRVFLRDLSPDAVGAPLASHDVECGIFCEERE